MKALGIILAGGNSKRMGSLSQRRAVAAMPMAGSYRSVDFALSNMASSSINTVAVITQYSSRSLNEHLSSSKWWDFGRKQGGLYMFHPTITPENSNWYRGTADALIQNLEFLRERHEPYVVIASGDGIYKIDFNAVLEYHMAKDAEVTVICHQLPPDEDISRFGVVTMDEDKRIVAWEEKQESASGEWINCGIYIVRRRHLIQQLERCRALERYDFVRDVLVRNLGEKRIVAYCHQEYWRNIATVESFYRTNMDFLNPELRNYFFRRYPSIRTKVDDNPPAKFNKDAMVRNSLVAGGSIVNGCAENSLLFKRVYIGNNSVVRNAILLDDVYIGDNVIVENCIVEARTKLEEGFVHRGDAKKVEVVGD